MHTHRLGKAKCEAGLLPIKTTRCYRNAGSMGFVHAFTATRVMYSTSLAEGSPLCPTVRMYVEVRRY